MNTPWFYFQLAAEGNPVTLCQDGAVASAPEAGDPIYKCSSYTDEGTAKYTENFDGTGNDLVPE